MKNIYKRLAAIFVLVLLTAVIAVPVLAAGETDAAAPAAAEETAETTGETATSGKAIGSGIAIGVAAGGGALGMGLAVAKAAEGISRQPEAENKIRTTLMLGLVFIETAIIYALVVAILVIFVL